MIDNLKSGHSRGTRFFYCYNSCMEYLDVLDEKGNKTGEVKSYNDVHRDGSIHRAVHVWIVNSNNKILIQKRSQNRYAYPGYWDISASGHVSKGQTSLEAAIRESNEELGINLSPDDLKFLFTLEEQIILHDGKYINNEFQDVYLVKKDIKISDLRFSDGEVETVLYVSPEEFKEWKDEKKEKMIPHREEHEKILEIILRM